MKETNSHIWKTLPKVICPGKEINCSRYLQLWKLENKGTDSRNDSSGNNEVHNLGRLEEAQTLRALWERETRKTGTKAEYIQFYKEVSIALEDASQKETAGILFIYLLIAYVVWNRRSSRVH